MPPKKKKAEPKDRYKSNLSFFHMSMAVNVLKNCSSAERPITLGEMQAYFSIIASDFNGRSTTFEKNFKELVTILESNTTYGLEMNLRTTFYTAFHGTIKRYPKGTFPPNKAIKNKRDLYYFEPLLDSGDVEYLTGAVTTNPYLSPEEKAYLETRARALTNENSMFDFNLMPGKYSSEIEEALNTPKYYKNKKSLSSLHVLRISSELNIAIIFRKKIQITYGRYAFDKSKRYHLKLMPIDKEYILDPYALCWNNGFYYLICMNSKYDNVTHFRVDRIISVEITGEDRRDVPDELAPYMHVIKNRRFFDALRYTNEHPLMSVYAESRRINCTFETTTLSIIIDHFGKNIHISKTDKTLPDMNGHDLPVFKADIENVEYSGALLFALQQNQLVKAIAPAELADEVKAKLGDALSNL